MTCLVPGGISRPFGRNNGCSTVRVVICGGGGGGGGAGGDTPSSLSISISSESWLYIWRFSIIRVVASSFLLELHTSCDSMGTAGVTTSMGLGVD